MSITIEDASVKDLDKLHEIEQKCFGAEAFTRPQIANLLTDYNTLSLVAKENDNIIGFIIGTIEFERSIPVGHILTIDVLPSRRKKGAGLSLLEGLEGIFKVRKAVESRLEVREGNAEALSLYGKIGYKKVGRLKGYYGHTDGLLLMKRLGKLQ